MDLLKDLNEPQRQAVLHVEGPLLVLAGAGSGKTRVITRRIAHLIQQGIAPWNVLAITFTNKASREMLRRVEDMNTPRGATVATFHSLSARLLREFAAEAGLSPNFTIYDTADQTRLAKLAIDRCELPAGTFTPGKVLHAISRIKMQLQTAQQYALQAHDFAARHIAKVYTAYQQGLDAAKAMDFDDLLMRMAFLLRDRPDVRQMLTERFRYILIDEYQDTNHAQYIIAHGIAMGHENVCATGDPDQSIYAWRGADVGNILDFEKDYPNAVVVRLEENYRSTAPILATASHLIAHNRQRKEKDLFTRQEGGQDVTIISAADEHTESAEVVNRVRTLISGGLAYSDIAIFYRLNSLSRVMEDALRKGGVPYRIARGVEFYNRKEIKDVLAYLKLIVNPDDEIACERIINVPARGIGATTINRLRAFGQGRGLSLFESARQARQIGAIGKSAVTKIEGFVHLIGELSQLIAGPVRSIVEAVVSKSGMETELKAAGSEDASELANVAELVTTAAEFDQANEKATLLDYLNQVALVSDVDHMEGSTGAITLMTLHAAKGLEFPAVFIVGCEEGLLPFQRMGDSPPDLEEERRLCFVGITRAMKQLFLTHAKYRGIRGQRQRQIPSSFLSEIGQESIRRIDLSEDSAPVSRYHSADDFDDARSSRRPADEEPAERLPNDDYFDADVQAALNATAAANTGGMKAGSRVRHAMFGAGRVDKVMQVGPYTRVVVEFDQFGRKTLILQYARLELLR